MIYNTDMFALFNVSADRKAAQLALADATMSTSFQSAFNVIKGSVPARMDVSDAAFDACGKKGIADVKAANAKGTFRRLDGPELRATAGGRRRLSRRRDQVLPRRDQDLRRRRRRELAKALNAAEVDVGPAAPPRLCGREECGRRT